MYAVLLPSGVNPIAVNKYINISVSETSCDVIATVPSLYVTSPVAITGE